MQGFTMTSRPHVDPAFLHSDLTDLVIAAFYRVYDALGFGFLESVYQNALGKALQDLGVPFSREVPIEVFFEGVKVGHFKADFLAAGKVILEIKSAQAVGDPDLKQLMNYLRSTPIEVGLVLNFGPKPVVMRRAFSNLNKRSVER